MNRVKIIFDTRLDKKWTKRTIVDSQTHQCSLTFPPHLLLMYHQRVRLLLLGIQSNGLFMREDQILKEDAVFTVINWLFLPLCRTDSWPYRLRYIHQCPWNQSMKFSHWRFLKTQFFWVSHFKIFFASFLWKLINIYWIEGFFTKFWWFPWFSENSWCAYTFATQCKYNQSNFSILIG